MISTKNTVKPRFEGFYIEMVMPDLQDRCQEIVSQVLGENWHIKTIGDNLTEFEVLLKDDALSVKQAWDKTYELRSLPGVVDVEPLFAIGVREFKQLQRREQQAGGEESKSVWDIIFSLLSQLLDLFSGGSGVKTGLSTNDVNWVLKELKVLQAWEKYFPDPNKLPGDGIIIAHPDTGYTTHPEIADNLLLEQGYDFLGSDEDETDPLEKSDRELVNNPGHGTLAASVMVSPPKAQANFDNNKYVTGVAPGAKLVPLRITYSVVLWSNHNLAQAIEYAADKGFHIISISLGAAFYNKRLRTAILYAQKRGVIIIAASGTWVPFVVFPAAYDEVIAVGGSTVNRKIWMGSPRGRKIDVCAPGEGVWYARTVKENGELKYKIQQGSGTSLSTPLVTGVAALWLSYHGRDNLIRRYGAEKIPFIFNQLLRDTCDVPPNWKPSRYGAGIVNAQRLLDAPLPDNLNQSVIPPAFALQQHTPVESGEIETFAHMFESVDFDINSLKSNLAQLMQTSERELPQKLREVGQELAFRFATDGELYEKFAASLIQFKNKQQQPQSREFQGLVPAADDKSEIREMLLNCDVSETLNHKLRN
ncbi:MAG: S8 family serine peptidase [Cyanobacteria bacterium J06633_8]